MLLNSSTVLWAKNCWLVPYRKNHVAKYHIWMQNKELRHLTGSDLLTFQEEISMQESWLKDEDKLTFLIADDSALKKLFESVRCCCEEKSPVYLLCSKLSGIGDLSGKIEGRPCRWCDQESNCLIGDINLFISDEDEYKSGEINLMIAERAYRRRGIGRTALCAFLNYSIEKLHVNYFVAKILQDNTSSISFFSSMGFEERERSDVFKEVTMVNKSWNRSASEDYSVYNF